MARLAAGDGAALFDLLVTYRADLVRSVRTIALARRVRLSAEEIDELVVAAAIAINDVASAWKPDGAPPWIYARGRIAAAFDALVGQHADPLDDARTEVEALPPAAGAEPATAEVFVALARENAMVALLQQGLEQVASPRDRVLFVEHGVQVAMGDPSPAVTVARMYGMEPAAVRQQTRRLRIRLNDLARTDPHFADLASLPLVA
jgi:hypothetical protein